MSDKVFTVDAHGTFEPAEVRVVWRDEPCPPDPDLDRLVAETWAEQVDACRLAGRILFNGQLARYLRHDVSDGILTIEAGPTDYARFLGTNFFNHHRGEAIGWERFSNPIGTSATVITSDEWLLYGRRNQRVVCHPGCLHTFGGTLEQADRSADDTFDAFAAILRELAEELGIEPGEVDRIVCLGLIRDPVTRQPELVFDAHIRLSRSVLADRIEPEAPDQEHCRIEACRDSPDAIGPFIRSAGLITAVAIGALCLHGRRSFGENWYRRMRVELAQRNDGTRRSGRSDPSG